MQDLKNPLPSEMAEMGDTTVSQIVEAMDLHNSTIYTSVGEMPDGRLLAVAYAIGDDAEKLAASVQARMNVRHSYPNP